MKDFGVYVKYVDLELFEQSSKSSAIGLMRNLIGIWCTNARLAAYSATSGINPNIRTAVFRKLPHDYTYCSVLTMLQYCETKYSGNITPDKLKRDLTSKCGEERRQLTKK